MQSKAKVTLCSSKLCAYQTCIIVFRSVDENLVVSEDYMSLSELPNTTSDTLYNYVKEILSQLNLPIEDCRGKAIKISF